MEYNIRKCKPQDRYNIYRLVNQLKEKLLDRTIFFKKFNDNLYDRNVQYWLLESENLVIGFVSVHRSMLLHHDNPVFEIHEFVIERDFRAKGYGSILMDFIITKFNNQELELASNKTRVKSKKFFEKSGFIASHNKFTRHK